MVFSGRVEAALRVCLCAHADQVRRGSPDTPYAVHPIQIALLAARLGEEDDVLIAALLHDVPEDCDGWDVSRIEAEFGARVAGIVDELSEDKSRTWEERKRDGIERVAGFSPEALRVKVLDKLHNLSSLADQLEAASDRGEVWKLFRGGRERTLEMSRELVEQLSERIDAAHAHALRSALERVAADG